MRNVEREFMGFRKLTAALSGLVLATGLAGAAKLYEPPGKVRADIGRALRRVQAFEGDLTISARTLGEKMSDFRADTQVQWDRKSKAGVVHTAGSFQNGHGSVLFQGDFREVGAGARYLRISYPTFRLINNQWVSLDPRELSGTESAGGWASLLKNVRLTKRLSASKVEGKRLMRYAISVGVPETRQFIAEELQVACSEVAHTSTPELCEKLAVGLNQVQLIDGEILVYPKGRLPALLSLVFHLKGNEEIHSRIAFTSFGKPVDAQTPNIARPLQEVVAQLKDFVSLKGGPLPLPPLGSATASLYSFENDFDHDGLTDAAEQMYGTDPANSDTDSDTFLDGEEVERGYNPRGEGNL